MRNGGAYVQWYWSTDAVLWTFVAKLVLLVLCVVALGLNLRRSARRLIFMSGTEPLLKVSMGGYKIENASIIIPNASNVALEDGTAYVVC